MLPRAPSILDVVMKIPGASAEDQILTNQFAVSYINDLPIMILG
jgi:hypothetical protein